MLECVLQRRLPVFGMETPPRNGPSSGSCASQRSAPSDAPHQSQPPLLPNPPVRLDPPRTPAADTLDDVSLSSFAGLHNYVHCLRRHCILRLARAGISYVRYTAVCAVIDHFP